MPGMLVWFVMIIRAIEVVSIDKIEIFQLANETHFGSTRLMIQSWVVNIDVKIAYNNSMIVVSMSKL